MNFALQRYKIAGEDNGKVLYLQLILESTLTHVDRFAAQKVGWLNNTIDAESHMRNRQDRYEIILRAAAC